MRRVKPASLTGIPVKRQPMIAEATAPKTGDLSERFLITENHPVAQRARIHRGFTNRVPRTTPQARRRWEPSWIDKGIAKIHQLVALCLHPSNKPAKPATDTRPKSSPQHITEIFS
jgi:hypothetical protein